MAKRIPYVLRKASIFSVLVCLVILAGGTDAKAGVSITAEQLADICERMEQSITDITAEYDYFLTPPYTFEELTQEGFTKVLLPKFGVHQLKFWAGGLAFDADQLNPNKFPPRFRMEERTTVVNREGKSWENVVRHSYDGSVGKFLSIGGLSPDVRPRNGYVFDKRPDAGLKVMTPLAWSVHRSVLTGPGWPLSKRLRLAGLTHVNDSVQKVNDFNSVCVDFLSEQKKRPYLRVYFSIDHGYTPVTHLYTKGSIDKVAFSFEVLSLQKVGEDLWFPEAGKAVAPGEPHVSVYAAKGDIKINQGLGPEDFDIDFPPGTEVHDEIRDVEYVVGAEQ